MSTLTTGARRQRDTIMRGDHVGPRLGINLVEIAPGTATVAMTATAATVNSVGVIHGGYIFTLADCALAPPRPRRDLRRRHHPT
jgi:acyl-CoA thioesterase